MSAKHIPVVAQVSNLLYRRASSLRTLHIFNALRLSDALPIGNRRYSRLETCATTLSRALPNADTTSEAALSLVFLLLSPFSLSP